MAAAQGGGGGGGGGGQGQVQGQFGDTTYTKVFVGGLAWETQRDTMRRYFEQFGEILEAVVITDKNTGRSKGYGFVTFRDPEAARRACVDAAPIIDGRRANCNLASLGAHRSRPSTPQHPGNRFRLFGSFHTAFQAATTAASFQAAPTFAQPNPFAIHQGFPYQAYGYSPYTDFNYSPTYYSPYGGSQVPVYTGPSLITGPAPAIGPYYQLTQALQGTNHGGYAQSQSFGMQLPPMMQYPSGQAATAVSSVAQQYGGMLTIPAALPPTGMSMTTLALPSQHFQMHSSASIQGQYAVPGAAAATEQPSA